MTTKPGNPHAKSGAIFSTFTHGLCAYNVWRLNDDVTAIEFSYRRRRESPKLHTADRGGIWWNQTWYNEIQLCALICGFRILIKYSTRNIVDWDMEFWGFAWTEIDNGRFNPYS